MFKRKIYSMINAETKAHYRNVGKTLKETMGVAKIAQLWNMTPFSVKVEEVSETTIDRWLQPGPSTKNPNFEPFVIALSLTNAAASLPEQMKRLEEALEADEITSIRDKATATSIVGFYSVDPRLSAKQIELVDSLISRL